MELPINPPILPMLAKRVDQLPASGEWIFEPKWDGFRALIFRDGKEVMIQSRDEKPLNRYFPELIDPILKQLPTRCVLDGEVVVAQNGALDFDALQLRIHPAASRIKLLSQQIPASIVFFDLLCEGKKDLRNKPFAERREKLESLLSTAKPPLHLTPATSDFEKASDWFRRFEGAGLDGVVAKPVNGTYESNKRVMLKVKHERDCDCVVAGFRWHKKGDRDRIGSLLLGLFNDAGKLQHVGVCASFADQKRLELVEFLKPYRKTRSRDIRGKTGPATRSTAFRARRVAGVTARIFRGSRCAPSSSLKLRTSTCRAIDFVTPPNFVAGAPTRSQKTAPTSSSK
jgi:ATP-dependent DNA ligase